MSVDSVGLRCPRCEAAVSEDARFCMNCGQPLAAATDEDHGRRARLAAAAPAPLVDKMRRAKLTGERKPVTALFADVVGSTALAEQMDPEDWTQLINEAFDLMSQAVFRYEGTIAQLQGDAMLAFFGAPVAHEDDPERAVRAALDMIAAVEEYARQLKQTHGISFRIRAGINSGPVIVGNVGSDLCYEYTALGDAVNVAARVQTSAEPGTVLITDHTQRFVSSSFDFDDLGAMAVKGKSDPLHLYRVTGLRATPGRRRGLESVGLSSPMIGRSAELDRLGGLYGVVAAGRGRVAIILGEPGLGKSRLLSELHAALTAPAEHGGSSAPPVWVEGRSVSYGRGLPYHLVLDLLHSVFEIPLGTSEGEVRTAVHRQLNEWLGDAGSDVEPYLANLLGLTATAAEAERVQLDPETLQGRYAASIKRVVAARSAEQPMIIVLEDVHWADPASVEVIVQLLSLLSQLRVLLICATRIDSDAPGWRLVAQTRTVLGEALTEIQLQPLDEADSRALVANLLEIESLPDHVRETILARSEGNPFFVEEVIRMFIEDGAIVRSGDRWTANETISGIEIPDTLHGLLLARIDQLPSDAKRTLRVASVIGRQFPVSVLERVMGDG